MQAQQTDLIEKMERLLKGQSASCDVQNPVIQTLESSRETTTLKAPIKSEPSVHQFLESLLGGSKKQQDIGWANGSGDSALQVVLANPEKTSQEAGIFSSASPSLNRGMATSDAAFFGKGMSDIAATTLPPAPEYEDGEVFEQAESSAQITTSAQLGFQNPGNFDVLQWCFAGAPKQKWLVQPKSWLAEFFPPENWTKAND